ncbi:MAG: hypothetical protein QG622_362 [Actinomycetota bacterium]|nr:hypothetical protein [Actinomycetota bacterium]
MRTGQRSCGRRAAAESLVVPTRLASGVPVLVVEGRLGSVDLTTCRKVLDDLLSGGPEVVVLDVRGTGRGDLCLVVLALIRRYAARRGARLALTASSRPLLAGVRQARLTGLYPVVRDRVTAA